MERGIKMSKFTLTFNVDNDSYYTVTRNDLSGYNLNKFSRAKEGSKKEYTQSTTYHASLEQIAHKLAYVELDGKSVTDVQGIMNNVATKIADSLKLTLEGEKG
jgi:hypothetical protein